MIGVNWYEEFDEPVKDAQGHYWIARDAKLTKVRGGHCVCLKPKGHADPDAWWDFYNQGTEGACVGFGISRLASQLNRKLYDGFWLYHEAQKIDEWPGEDYDGTLGPRRPRHPAQARALREQGGPGQARRRSARASRPTAGRAASTTCCTTLGYGGLDYVDVLNSWGRSYPHLTRMPAKVLERLWKEDGEVGLVTDR